VQVTFGNGGWVALGGLDPELPGPVYIRFREINGRMRMTEFYLDASGSEGGIEAEDLRAFPVRQVEALVNEDAVQLKHFEQRPAPDLSVLASYFTTDIRDVVDLADQVGKGNWVVASLVAQQLPPSEEQGTVFGSPQGGGHQLTPGEQAGAGFAVMRVRRRLANWEVREVDTSYRLERGPDDGLTNEFLSTIARAYNAAIARGESPCKAIAGQTGHGKRTVERWVYTARQRGIMPRGRKGVSG
jgi:hypothetical protein